MKGEAPETDPGPHPFPCPTSCPTACSTSCPTSCLTSCSTSCLTDSCRIREPAAQDTRSRGQQNADYFSTGVSGRSSDPCRVDCGQPTCAQGLQAPAISPASAMPNGQRPGQVGRRAVDSRLPRDPRPRLRPGRPLGGPHRRRRVRRTSTTRGPQEPPHRPLRASALSGPAARPGGSHRGAQRRGSAPAAARRHPELERPNPMVKGPKRTPLTSLGRGQQTAVKGGCGRGARATERCNTQLHHELRCSADLHELHR